MLSPSDRPADQNTTTLFPPPNQGAGRLSSRAFQLQLALDAFDAGLFEFDISTLEATWDAKLEFMLGMPPPTPQSKITDFETFIHPADRIRLHPGFHNASSESGPFTYEATVRAVPKNDEDTRWLHLVARLSPKGENDFHVAGIITDVTEERRIEEQTRESRSKINNLLNRVPQMIWTTTANGRHLYANSRCLNYTGFDENKRSLGWLYALHPDDAPHVIAKWNAAMTSGDTFEAEYRLRDRDGNDTWFFGRSVPLRDEHGHVTEWFGTAIDIHEKKLAEAKRNRIQRKVAQLQSIASALAFAHKPLEVAQLVIDQGLKPIDADAGFIVLSEPRSDSLPLLYSSGYASADLEKLKHLTIHAHLPAAEVIRTREPLFLVGREDLSPYEASLVAFDTPNWQTIAAVPLIVQGQALGALAISYSNRAEFSEERIGYLTILAEQCAQAIERSRLYEAEQIARRKAETASLAKTQFLTNMSHEIRTPLNAILGFSDLLNEPTLSSAERDDYRSRIRMNGDQLMRLIDDILDLSKSETGRIQVHLTEFSIIELVREIHDSMASATRKKGILTRITTDASVPHAIESDPIRLRQILTNLIGNSIKFTDHGRIETRVDVKESESKEQYLVIEVEDTGIGISPELHQRLFQPFVQGDSSITRRFGGSGLGLVVSRSVAEAMGGTLELIRSSSVQGSVFRLTIPLPQKTQSPQIGMFEKPVRDGQPPRELEGVQVLLVEDSFDNEMLIRAYLKGTGVQLEVAHNGAEAVDRALDRKFDVVFMDIQMPVMDGLEATRRLKSRHYDRPIVALSAHALPEEVERSLAAGCHSHLTKPIMKSVLIDQIRSLRHYASSPPVLFPGG